MRTLLLAAVAVAAAATSASAQTCTANDIAFITAPSGPFATVCAAQQTLTTLTPFGMAITQLLDPTQSTLTFLNSQYITTRVNGALDVLAKSVAKNPNVTRALLGWPAYPFSQAAPTYFNFSSTIFELIPGNASTSAGQAVNGTVGGAVAYILCPTLKQIVRDLIACVPANCSGVVTSLCDNPTPTNAIAQLGAAGGVTPFATGTLAVLQNIRALCGGALAFSQSEIAAVLPAAGLPLPNTTVACSVVAPPALVGTFQYPSTSSPTRAGSAAGVAAGAVAAVAAVAAAAFAF